MFTPKFQNKKQTKHQNTNSNTMISPVFCWLPLHFSLFQMIFPPPSKKKTPHQNGPPSKKFQASELPVDKPKGAISMIPAAG